MFDSTFTQKKKVLPNLTEPLEVEIMKSNGFFPYEYWYWIGVGELIGFILLFNIYFTLALTYLNRAYLLLSSLQPI